MPVKEKEAAEVATQQARLQADTANAAAEVRVHPTPSRTLVANAAAEALAPTR